MVNSLPFFSWFDHEFLIVIDGFHGCSFYFYKIVFSKVVLVVLEEVVPVISRFLNV